MVDSINASAAYRKIASMPVDKATSGVDLSSGPAPTGKVNFAELLGKTFQEAQGALHTAENSAAMVATNQKVDVAKVVTAVSEAEFVLQTIVAVRDKIIAAYQDIMRMQV